MPDFEALNKSRLETLSQIREMISEDSAVWGRFPRGRNTSEMIAHLEKNRTRFRELWDVHEDVRRQMVEVGFLPPPLPALG